MEKVLVTGGSGFIGLHCIQQLLDQGYDVRCTVRSESKKQEIVESMTKHSSNVNNLEVVMADLLKDMVTKRKRFMMKMIGQIPGQE